MHIFLRLECLTNNKLCAYSLFTHCVVTNITEPFFYLKLFTAPSISIHCISIGSKIVHKEILMQSVLLFKRYGYCLFTHFGMREMYIYY